MTKKIDLDDGIDRDIALGWLQSAGTMMVVKLEDLNIDRDHYQRNLREHHKKIAKEFDPRACDPLKIGKRPDGSMWLIDGQQRRQALLKMGIMEWNAVVFHSDGPETEARIFAICGGGKGTVKKLSDHEVIRALLAAKDPLAITTNMAIELAGLKWRVNLGSDYVKWPYISMHKQMMVFSKRFGMDKVSRALKLLARTWPMDDNAVKAEVVWPVITIIGLHGDRIKEDRFAHVLSQVPALKIVQHARQNEGSWRYGHSYTFIVKKYNSKLTTNRLPEFVQKKEEEAQSNGVVQEVKARE